MDFLYKLDSLMECYGLNKRTLSQKSDIPYTTVANWCKEEIMAPNYGRTHGFEVEYNEMEHIKKYRFIFEYSPEGAKTVDAVLNREYCMAGQLKEQSKRIAELENITLQNNIPTDSTRIINYYYRLALAGIGQIVFDTPPIKRIEIPTSRNIKKSIML